MAQTKESACNAGDPGSIPGSGRSYHIEACWHKVKVNPLNFIWSEATVRTGHETTERFQMGKEYVKAVYCHPVYLTYMQSTS